VTRARKPSAQTVAVLHAFASEPTSWRYGYDLVRETGLKAGSLYPILMRLADRGQLEARWEPSQQPGIPARHLYRLTAAGLAVAAESSAPSARVKLRVEPWPQPGGS
jgi:PadR family transcriptional regulator, regulatory protein PadR